MHHNNFNACYQQDIKLMVPNQCVIFTQPLWLVAFEFFGSVDIEKNCIILVKVTKYTLNNASNKV